MYSRLFAGLIGAGLLLAPMLSAQAPAAKPATAQQAATKNPSRSANRSMDESSQAIAETGISAPQSMSQAIAWERFKDAAAARQARLEAKHPSEASPNANRSVEESKPANTVKDPGPAVKKDK